MARRVKPKIKYNKNKKTPKAFVGAATAGLGLGKMIYGGIQARKAKKEERAFDKDRLKGQVSSATQKMADQPMDQGYIEQMQGQQAADRASAMGALSKDPRNALAGVQALESQAAKQRTDLMGMQQRAKTSAMQNLAKEQQAVEKQRLDVAGAELEGIRGQKAAAEQNIFGGLEDVASGVAEYQESKLKKGGKIGEDGGVTPGEFSHEENPIDMVQDGEKVGEATGGELILPPDDVDDIRSALKDGDKEAAFKLMEDLVAKYDKNVIGDDDSEAQEGGKVKKPTVPPLNQDRAQEIVRVMKGNADQVRNVGELPFDEDPTNPAGLVKYVGDKLSFDIDSTSKAEIDFIKNYREHLINDKGRVDAPQSKMMGGGYLSKVKARVGAYMKSKY
jgi:hypothetical protein